MGRGMPDKIRVGLEAVTHPHGGVPQSYRTGAEQGLGPGQDQYFLVLHRSHRSSFTDKNTLHKEGSPLYQCTQPVSNSGASYLVTVPEKAYRGTPRSTSFVFRGESSPERQTGCLRTPSATWWAAGKDTMEVLLQGSLKPAPSADQTSRDWLIVGEQVEIPSRNISQVC